jgi:hypothetical protein
VLGGGKVDSAFFKNGSSKTYSIQIDIRKIDEIKNAVFKV